MRKGMFLVFLIILGLTSCKYLTSPTGTAEPDPPTFDGDAQYRIRYQVINTSDEDLYAWSVRFLCSFEDQTTDSITHEVNLPAWTISPGDTTMREAHKSTENHGEIVNIDGMTINQNADLSVVLTSYIPVVMDSASG